MKRDLFIQYDGIPTGHTDMADLAELGITMKPAAGTCCIWPDNDGNWWKEIGAVIVWDDTRRIDLHPYQAITDDDRGYLATIGWTAWINPPTIETQWAHDTSPEGRGYWHQTINAEVFDDDTEIVHIIAAASSHRERNDHALGFDAA